MAEEISPEIQKHMMEFQAYQQQLQAVMSQRNALSMQMIETERAVAELEKTNETHVYRAIGNILVKTGKEEAKKDLLDKKEFFNMRIQAMAKEDKRIREKLKELQAKLQGVMKASPDR